MNPEQKQAGEAAHTPTPWKNYGLYRQTDGHNGLMVGQGGMTVCEVLSGTLCPPEVRDANAAFIVRACNAYDSDQRKIKALEEALTEVVSQKFSHTEMVWKARIALALAKEDSRHE